MLGWHSPPHQGSAQSRRDHGGDHGSAEALRRSGRPGLQSRRANPGRGTSTSRVGETLIGVLAVADFVEVAALAQVFRARVTALRWPEETWLSSMSMEASTR